MPKTLIYDLELSPHLGWSWTKWETNIISFLCEKRIISIAYKWLGDKDIKVMALPDFPGYQPGLIHFIENPKNNKLLVEFIHDLLSQADLSVAHNGDGFDNKVCNTAFVYHGLKPIPPRKTRDTLKLVKKVFAFASNGLSAVCEFLGIGAKLKTPGFSMWLGCMAGDEASWRTMKRYNRVDVWLLEKLHLRTRGWDEHHPDMNKFDGHVGCPTCRSTKISQHVTGSSLRYQCDDCHRWMRLANTVKLGFK